MNRHQADRVDRVDRRVRLVADRQLVEMIGDAGQRRVAAVLKSGHHAAKLLQVLPRLRPVRSSRLECVGRFGEQQIDQSQSATVDPRTAASADRRAKPRQHSSIVLGEEPGLRPTLSGSAPAGSCSRIAAASEGASDATPASDRRTIRDRSSAAARRFDMRIREVAEQRHDVLHFVRVEKTESLVDVGRHAARARALSRIRGGCRAIETGRDVCRPRRREPGRSFVANRRAALEEAGDLGGHAIGCRVHRVGHDQPERRRAASCSASIGNRSCRLYRNASLRSGAFSIASTDVVDERQELGCRPEADRDGPARVAVRLAARRRSPRLRRGPRRLRPGSRKSTACDRRR